MTAENATSYPLIAAGLRDQIRRLEQAYEDKVAENGCLEIRVAELEVDLAARERQLTGLEIELSAARMSS